MKLLILFIPALLVTLSSKTQPIEAGLSKLITKTDLKVLCQIRHTFLPKFRQERVYRHQQQFAVLYYGAPDLKTGIKWDKCTKQTHGRVFIDHPFRNFNSKQCNYIAARQPAKRRLHTEAIILKSLNTCPKTYNRKIYLYSHRSPCVKCDEIIIKFVTKCEKNFDLFIIGYTKEHKNIDKSTKILENINKVVMTQI
jgi:hypothetical protein